MFGLNCTVLTLSLNENELLGKSVIVLISSKFLMIILVSRVCKMVRVKRYDDDADDDDDDDEDGIGSG